MPDIEIFKIYYFGARVIFCASNSINHCVYFFNFLKGRKKAKVVEAEETTVVALYSFGADHFENLTFEKCNLLINFRMSSSSSLLSSIICSFDTVICPKGTY